MSAYRINDDSPGFLVCDRGVCLYADQPVRATPPHRAARHRCIRHGAILTYVPEYTGLTEREARQRHAAARAVKADIEGEAAWTR